MKKQILHLNLKKQWFDMILSGEKTEEYREIKPYWQKRFKPHSHVHIGSTWWPKNHVQIVFSNGYAKDRRQMVANITGMRFESEGREEWGAEKGKKYFVLELGAITPVCNHYYRVLEGRKMFACYHCGELRDEQELERK